MLPSIASAQGYGYDGGSYGYDRGGIERRERWRDREDRVYGRPPIGGICVTARGSCRTRPGPINAPCGCDIPGLGYKRGGIGRY